MTGRRRAAAGLAPTFSALVLLMAPGVAWAGPDTFGTGAGTTPLSVTTDGVIVNDYEAIDEDADAGDTTVNVDWGFTFSSGNLVLIIQNTGLATPEPGTPDPVSLSDTAVGRWELARVTGRNLFRITLSAPLINSYQAGQSQVVQVPEYSTVTVSASGRITAPPFDPDDGTGGIVALLANGAVVLDGGIDASGLGLPGGAVVDDPGENLACQALDEAPSRGAQRGAGHALDAHGAASTGRGNLGAGGGGGVCLDAGGGGGGHAGVGGKGGTSDASLDGGRDVGGLGGARASHPSLLRRLTFGSGGGAGHGNEDGAGAGGRGGGIVFLRAASASGSGGCVANGADGESATGDGAGGGGAGGSILVQVESTATFAGLAALGGLGGGTDVGHGTGGGGGAGRVLLQSTDPEPPSIFQVGGAPGTGLAGQTYLAQSGDSAEPDAAPDTGLSTDLDGDGLQDAQEASGDSDGDGDDDDEDPDDDGDGVPTRDEGTEEGVAEIARDTDRDGIRDYLDDDDDGDLLLTRHEDVDGNNDPRNDDSDGDGTPDYLAADDAAGIPPRHEALQGNGDP
ncbi:MAG: hypothetical protein OXU20_15565, partial [Myxococcales bacterium]|nr:hypothetical protein [Myxococcales bacterium]